MNTISRYSDTLTVTAPGFPAGTPLVVNFIFQISGFTSVFLSGQPGQTGGLVFFPPPYTRAQLSNSFLDGNFASFVGPGTFTSRNTFQSGVAPGFGVTLFASVTSDFRQAAIDWSSSYEYYYTQGRSDYSSTGVLTGIEVTDENENPIPNAQVRDSDGALWKPLPPLKVLSVARSGNGPLVLEASGVPDAAHTIKVSSDLSPDSFVPLDPPVTADANGMLRFEVAEAANTPQRFYRVTFP